MKRRQLFEFNEAAWLPSCLRALITDYLRVLVELIEPFSPQLPLLTRALRQAGADAGIIDLGAGSGGPWRHLSPQLNRLAGRQVPVLLTDKFPNPEAADHVSALDNVRQHSSPVDATAVPAAFKGMRSIFNGLHQYAPDKAVAVLRDCIAQRHPIAVMEMLRRTPLNFLYLLLTPILVWLVTPLIRPFSMRRLALTYLVPIAPLLILWDSLVSALRCYQPAELLAMAQKAGGSDYQWHAGTYRHRGVPVTFLIGFPRSGSPEQQSP